MEWLESFLSFPEMLALSPHFHHFHHFHNASQTKPL